LTASYKCELPDPDHIQIPSINCWEKRPQTEIEREETTQERSSNPLIRSCS
jgi:hypothetical protein